MAANSAINNSSAALACRPRRRSWANQISSKVAAAIVAIICSMVPHQLAAGGEALRNTRIGAVFTNRHRGGKAARMVIKRATVMPCRTGPLPGWGRSLGSRLPNSAGNRFCNIMPAVTPTLPAVNAVPTSRVKKSCNTRLAGAPMALRVATARVRCSSRLLTDRNTATMASNSPANAVRRR